MSERTVLDRRVPASGTVHWLGTGRSTGRGLRLLCERPARVVVWGRTVDRANQCMARLGLTGQVDARAYDPSTLAALLRPGDVVASMLPTAEHVGLLRMCVGHRAHFACSSYASPEMVAFAAPATAAGTVVLAEAGLDPGIDHALSHTLVAQARGAVGDNAGAAWFTSYCGGLPAVANEFRYRFSWAPRGVLTALCSPARYLDQGAEQTTAHPWEATAPLDLDGEQFEAYPNRDSLPFIARYGLPPAWRLQTFVRGTLRLSGWRDAWAPVFAELRRGDSARTDALAAELAARYPMTEADRDRVVLAVALTVRADAGPRWSGSYLLDLTGDPTESAMARCVSTTLAFGIGEILDDAMTPGLHRAADDGDEAGRWIDFLRNHGIECSLDTEHPVQKTS